ncbi:50S ribosomal protein L7/L12 [Micromonospora sp. NPDC050686]|uniref:50S ribosomal protein L7/L12 n=1 Tax=Micromonospora sp. NPDC050686 TaxID=3154631 RepID=UPI0033E5F138
MSAGVQVALGVAVVVVVLLVVVLGRATGRPRELGAPGRSAEGGQAEVLRLVGERRTVEAVKVLRQQTGLPLLEAKRVVDLLAAGGSWSPGSAPPGADVDDGVRAEAARLAHGGRKIQAIKLVREHTNWSLAEAKGYVERL